MIITAFDSETTDLLNFGKPLDHPSQPGLIQMALVMADTKSRKVLKKASFIVQTTKPIGPKAFEAHGITAEISASLGIRLTTAMAMFKHFAERSDRMVAHNKDFDLKIFLAQALSIGFDMEFMRDKDVQCTMAHSKKLVNSPPSEKMLKAGMKGPKAPRLEECVKHFYGETLEGAHDALVDTEGCLRVYFTLLDMGIVTEPF